MAHVLLIESWVRLTGSTGGVLPVRLRRMGHRFTFAAQSVDRYRAVRDAQKKAHPVLTLAERVLEVDTNDIPALCARAAELHALDPFDGTFTGCDFYLEAVAQVASHLGLPGNDAGAVHLAYNKHLMREAQQRRGIPTPRVLATASLDEARRFARSLGFPIVVKPTDLGGSELVRRVDDEAELTSAFGAILADRTNSRGQPRVPLVLLEEMMLGEEVSVETFTSAGRTRVIGVTDKTVSGAPAFIETLHMFPARLTPEARSNAEQAALSTLNAIGYRHGLAHTEVKLTPDGARVVEVNARMAGGHIPRLIELTTGLDLFELGVRLALGEVGVDDKLVPPRGSAAVAYFLPPRAGRFDGIDGVEELLRDEAVSELELRCRPGERVQLGGDNDDCIGHFIVRDARSDAARARAEALLARVHVRMSEPS